MANFFNSVRITNFKSLKDVTLSDCRRINVLIGKPNVGKSNILEALGLFSLPYVKYNKSKKITQFIRLENLAELFFDGDIENMISVKVNSSTCVARYLKDERVVLFGIELKEPGIEITETEDKEFDLIAQSLLDILARKKNHTISVDNKLNLSIKSGKYKKEQPKIKFYRFPQNPVPYVANFLGFFCAPLTPPFGANIFDVIQYKKLEKALSEILAGYGLKLLFDKTNSTIRIVKSLQEENTIASFPYNSIADTLQRIIFFKTAIASNFNSTILFEEPEAHCFPPYIAQITQDIIDSETNQFFIATHSPYVLNDFLEDKETRAQLAIYMADFKDGQTVVYRLTDEELDEVYNYGIDVFFNYERFTAHG